MLNEQEAQQLIDKLLELKELSKTNKSKIIELKRHEAICVSKFKYLITMRTCHYQNFSNHEDLVQEGYEALTRAISTYKKSKGSFFWWAHKYIDTRISRSANLHTTIRYPLKIAKNNKPHKEVDLPILIEKKYNPDSLLENAQLSSIIEESLSKLLKEEREIIIAFYGLNGDKPKKITKISRDLSISKESCEKYLNSGMISLKENLKL